RVPSFLLLVLVAFYFYGLGRLPLVGPDEPRYAQVAREMLLRGDLITPTLGGHVWFEKPVLLYWLMIAAYKVFGVNEFAARLGPALAGVLTILAIFWLARKIEVAGADTVLTAFHIWSGIVTATMLGIIVFSRAASFDILVTMTTTWSLVFFVAAELDLQKRNRVVFLAAFYIFIGLSLLAKGLVGLLPLAVAFLFFVLRRRMPPRQVILSLVWGIPLALLVAAFWFGAVIVRNGAPFVQDFIVQHHFARYFSNKYHHPQPIYFYPVTLLPMTLPWTPFFLYAVAKVRDWSWRTEEPLEKVRVLSLIWILVPLVVFSFSGSKLPGYILPVLPPVALLTGEQLSRFVSKGASGGAAMRTTALLCVVFAVGGFFYARQQQILSSGCVLAIAAPLLVVGLIAAIWKRYRTMGALLIAGSTVLAMSVLLNCGVYKVAERESTAGLIEAANARGYEKLRIGELNTIDHTAEFYGSGRLLYGSDGEPKRFEGTNQVLEALPQNGGRILILVPVDQVSALTNLERTTTDLIGSNGKIAIVAVTLKR
ncbi:MAG TPA: glycosyltransferase family 39 protein, partial [Pyrinomonadaceae bacterium]